MTNLIISAVLALSICTCPAEAKGKAKEAGQSMIATAFHVPVVLINATYELGGNVITAGVRTINLWDKKLHQKKEVADLSGLS